MFEVSFTLPLAFPSYLACMTSFLFFVSSYLCPCMLFDESNSCRILVFPNERNIILYMSVLQILIGWRMNSSLFISKDEYVSIRSDINRI